MNDAFFNYSVADDEGNPLDMEEILTLVKEKKFDKITLNFSKKPGKKILENENKVINYQIPLDEFFYNNIYDFTMTILIATGEKQFICGVLFPSGTPDAQFERVFIKANQVRHEMGIPDTIMFPENQ